LHFYHSHAYKFLVWKSEFSDIVVNIIKEFDDVTFCKAIFSSKNIIVLTDTPLYLHRIFKENENNLL